MLWDDFTTQENIDTIQYLIQTEVRNDMNVVIPPQNQPDLVNMMRSIYVQNPNMTLQNLNLAVVNQAMNVIVPAVNLDIHYQNTSGTRPPPLPLPVNVSTTGIKSGEVKIGLNSK